MNSPFYKIFTIFLIILALNSNIVDALEFRKEADKAKWIKEFFKDRQFDIHYSMDAIEEEKLFEQQLLKDFVAQNGIENIKPIAQGNNINEPEIAKFNIACPEKKPINIYKIWQAFGSKEVYQATEKELEDTKNQEYIDQYSCNKNIKIFKFDVYNINENQENYILYCEDFRLDEFRNNKKIYESSVFGAYLLFDPKQCLYSKVIYSKGYPLRKNYVSGVFKYKGYYFFYSTETFNNEVDLQIYREGSGCINNICSKYFWYTSKETVK